MARETHRTAEKIFAILECLDEHETPLSIREIVAETAIPPSTAAWLVRSLVTLGYLVHDRSSRTYMPSVKLSQLSAWVSTRHALAHPIRTAVHEVRDKTGFGVVVGTRNDIRLQYLYMVGGERSVSVVIRPGTTRLLCRTALGWALMSFLPQKAVESIVRRTNAQLPPEDRLELSIMLTLIEACRQDGYAFSQHTVRPGFGTLSLPIHYGRHHYAIGVSGPVEELKDEIDNVLSAMKTATAKMHLNEI